MEIGEQATSTTGALQFLTEFDLHLFHEGTHARLYEKLGSRCGNHEGLTGACFSLWAPNARTVSVLGEFNHWDPLANRLEPVEGSGIWSGFVPGVRNGEVYQYQVTSWHQAFQAQRADPFGFRQGPQDRSFVWDLGYEWRDQTWTEQRRFAHHQDAPIAVYQVHLGSWMRVPEEGGRMLTAYEIAPKLAEYVHRLGFSHVELLPVMQHASDSADEFEIDGYFAVDRRYGAPQDLKFLIDYLHQHGVGVILDWPGAHFAAPDSALAYFDGTHLYEHGFWQLDVQSDGTGYCFDFSRPEVRSFLLSNALFWLDEYHVDGLRLDALASMLYLDYGRRPGEWIPNPHGGRENLDAIQFLKQLNLEIGRQHNHAPMIAEDRSAWPMLTHAPTEGGLGFGFKWDVSFVEDTLSYFQHDPYFRKFHHGCLTRRSGYAYSESFFTPLSHEFATPGPSLLARMPGDEWQRFANLRLLFGFLWLQPGKKLAFMGDEFGQWLPWNRNASLDWHLCAYPYHQKLQLWVGDLNRLYREQPALSLSDSFAGGFEWVDRNDAERGLLGWTRTDPDAREVLLTLCNFTPVVHRNVRLGVRRSGWWRELLNSDAKEYAGSGQGNFGRTNTIPFRSHDQQHTLTITAPPLAIVVFKQEETPS